MRHLLDEDLFSTITDLLSQIALDIKEFKRTVLLVAPPTVEGALALVPLEAAFLDENLPYRRRFSTTLSEYTPSINILHSDEAINSSFNSKGMKFHICDIIVEGFNNPLGDSKKGPLTSITQAHALAQAISPRGSRVRKLRPWLLSGNWIEESLDNTYDPVFSKLKDILKEEGSIKIIPIPEVNKPYLQRLKWLNNTHLNDITALWANLDIESKAELLSNLVKPILPQTLPSTARVEELIWNCIIGPGWQTDIAGQIYSISDSWDAKNPSLSANNLVDKLLKDGVI